MYVRVILMYLNCDVGEDSWESWTARRSNQSTLKEITGRTDTEAETTILWLPDKKNLLIRKDPPDAGKDWRQEKKGTTENEIVGWHHWLNWHEFEQALGVSEEQGSLVCCSPWGGKEPNMTEQLNWTESAQVHYRSHSTLLLHRVIWALTLLIPKRNLSQ